MVSQLSTNVPLTQLHTDVVFDVTPILRRSEIYFTLLVSDFIVLFFFLFFFFSDKCQSAAIFD